MTFHPIIFCTALNFYSNSVHHYFIFHIYHLQIINTIKFGQKSMKQNKNNPLTSSDTDSHEDGLQCQDDFFFFHISSVSSFVEA